MWSAGAGKLRASDRPRRSLDTACLEWPEVGVGLAGWGFGWLVGGFDLLLSPSTSHLYCLQALLSLAAVKRNLRRL